MSTDVLDLAEAEAFVCPYVYRAEQVKLVSNHGSSPWQVGLPPRGALAPRPVTGLWTLGGVAVSDLPIPYISGESDNVNTIFGTQP